MTSGSGRRGDEAEAGGRELLTPRGAAELFGKASQTVRQAVRLQQVDAPYTLNATGKPVSLLLLDLGDQVLAGRTGGLLRPSRQNAGRSSHTQHLRGHLEHSESGTLGESARSGSDAMAQLVGFETDRGGLSESPVPGRIVQRIRQVTVV